MTDIAQPSPYSAPASTPEASPPTEKPVTVETIFADILERSGLDSLLDVPRTSRIIWEGPDGALMVINLVAENPLGSGRFAPADSPFEKAQTSVILGIFHNDEEIRVYTFPKQHGVIARYHLSKRGRTIVVDQLMSLDQFIDEMALEYQLAAGDDDDDAEDEADEIPNQTSQVTP